MAMNLKYLTVVILGSLLVSPSGFALESFKDFRRDTWDFEVSTDYFYSDANHLKFGDSSRGLMGENTYQLIDSQLRTRYMPRPTNSFFGWVTLSNAESVDAIATRTNSVISSAALGMDFLMYSELFEAIGEVIAVVPIDKVDSNSDSVFTNEGVFEVQSRMIVQKDVSNLKAYGWLGFNYRAGGRSFLMPWGAGAHIKTGMFLLGGEIFGFQSVTDDADKTNYNRNSYINTVNAGSLKFYSVNPSWVDSKAYVQAQLTPSWMIQAHGGMVLTGENAAAGFHVGAFLRYSFDMTKGYRVRESSKPVKSATPTQRSRMRQQQDTEVSSEKKVKRFREQTTDGVDQRLFRRQPKPSPPPEPKIDDAYLQQQLDATEFEVELKRKRGR